MPNEPDLKTSESPKLSYAMKPVVIDSAVLAAANTPFLVCKISLLALLFTILAPYIMAATGLKSPDLGLYFGDKAGSLANFFGFFAIHLILFLTVIISAIIGYRIITASGAANIQVIPQQDYPLLAPLVAEGKAEAIDQYVRLSTLSGFTGTFTQLGLTGLPLATIFLTLIFAGLTLVDSANFLDLTKLTLGAFIGSFVQRQVERRSEDAKKPTGESIIPSSAR
jgi:hypothetical protein